MAVVPNQLQIDSFEIELDVRIAATRETVFAALTEEIGRWWTLHLLGKEHATMLLEPRIGGRFFEDTGDGSGALWGTVMDLVPSKLLRFGGPLGMRTPVTNVVDFVLEGDRGTTVKVKHVCCGLLETGAKEKHLAFWTQICEALKRHAERSPSILNVI